MEKDWLESPFELKNKAVWVAGYRGMVGATLIRRLESEKCNILKSDIDLRVQADVDEWVRKNAPDVIVIAAAKVGGILANDTYPADFIYDNLMIQANIIHAAHKNNVEKLLFLGSSCIYPKEAAQPINEESLMSGRLEPTNEAYAVAKIAGIKLCQAYRKQYGCDFISVMPCNLYGPGDKFDRLNSHVIPALMMKAHAAKSTGGALEVWGSGRPRREFLYIDDLADALVFALKNYSSKRILNIGAGADLTIAELAAHVAAAVGFKGEIVFDPSKPDGTMQKLMDSSRIYAAGWKPATDLDEGLAQTYQWYLESQGMRDAA